MKPITDFGLEVKGALLKAGLTQEWLITQVRSKTGMYVDRSRLHKIFTGRSHSKRLISAICEVLGIDKPEIRQRPIQ